MRRIVFSLLAVTLALALAAPLTAGVNTLQAVPAVVSEAEGAVDVVVRLSRPLTRPCTVRLESRDLTAYSHDMGTGRDYHLRQLSLDLQPDSDRLSIGLDIVDDKLFEPDEEFAIRLVPDTCSELTEPLEVIVTIADDDRPAMLSVRDFGAAGDGLTDDTTPVQTAINTLAANGGGVLLFPAGTYVISSIALRDGITYFGKDAVILAAPNTTRWARVLSFIHFADQNSRPLIFAGLRFDGNLDNQPSYRAYELEQAHLLFLGADRRRPGRAVVFIQDCSFVNGVADGLSFSTNVTARVYNVVATDLFRGGLVATGGNSDIVVHQLNAQSGVRGLATGLHIEVDGEGFGGNKAMKFVGQDIDVAGTKLTLLAGSGSSVQLDRVTAGPPFTVFGHKADISITHSQLTLGLADTYVNRILCPGRLRIADSDVTVTRWLTGKRSNSFAGANIWWTHSACGTPAPTGQSVLFHNVQFRTQGTFLPEDVVTLIDATADQPGSGNSFAIIGGTIASGFSHGLSVRGAATFCITARAEGQLPLTVDRLRRLLTPGEEGVLSVSMTSGILDESTGCVLSAP